MRETEEAYPRGMSGTGAAGSGGSTSETEHLWTNRLYVTWLISDTSKGLAGTLLSFAIPRLTLMVTDDPAQAGIIGGVGMAVQIVSTLAGGVLADRHSRVRLMVIGGLIGAALSAGFVVVAWADSLTFTSLLATEVLLALRGGIFNTAGEAQLKSVVPAGAMGRAQAANQGRDAALQIAGNPIGGFLLGIGGWMIGAAMCIAHLVSTVSAAILGRMGDLAESGLESAGPAGERSAMGTDEGSLGLGQATAAGNEDLPVAFADSCSTRTPVAGHDGTRESKPNAAAEIREAFGWLFARPDLRNAVLIATIVNLGLNAAITTAIYVLQQGGYSPVEIGTVSSAIGIVMLIGALIAPVLVRRVGAGCLIVSGLVLLAAGVGALAATRSLVGTAAVLSVSSLLVPALNSGLLGYFMVAVPTEMLGRANSVLGILAMGAMPLGPLVAGFGLAWVGRTGTILLCTGLCVGAAAIAAFSVSVRSIPKEAEWAEHAAAFA